MIIEVLTFAFEYVDIIFYKFVALFRDRDSVLQSL